MNVYNDGTVANLQGDLTHSGVTNNIINLLAVSLQKIVSGGDKTILIDCERIRIAYQRLATTLRMDAMCQIQGGGTCTDQSV